MLSFVLIKEQGASSDVELTHSRLHCQSKRQLEDTCSHHGKGLLPPRQLVDLSRTTRWEMEIYQKFKETPFKKIIWFLQCFDTPVSLNNELFLLTFCPAFETILVLSTEKSGWWNILEAPWLRGGLMTLVCMVCTLSDIHSYAVTKFKEFLSMYYLLSSQRGYDPH